MYCKKCGKKLSSASQFCDRCGYPTKDSIPPRRTQSQPQNRNHHHNRPEYANDSYTNYMRAKMKREMEIKRKKRRMRIITVWIIMLAIISSIGGGFFSYFHTKSTQEENPIQSTEGTNIQSEKNTDAESEATEESETETKDDDTQANTESDAESDTESEQAQSNGCEIYIDKAHGFKCPYPSSFVVGTLSNKNTRLSIKDPEGDGEMLISYEKISETQKATILMRDYVKGIGVEPDYNRASSDRYEVTFTRSGKVNHRKAIIIDGTKYVYYDFTYGVDSESKDTYEAYIDYADEYLESYYPENADETDSEKDDTSKDSAGE